jgi:hypothetical protein
MAEPRLEDIQDRLLPWQEAVRGFGFEPQQAVSPDASGHSLLVSARSWENKSVKLFLKWRATEPVFQIWLYLQLSENGFKLLPHFYKTEVGSITFACAGKYWTCQPFVRSDYAYDWLNFNCPPQHCFEAGETLAELHASAARLPGQYGEIYPASRAADLFGSFPLQFQKTAQNFLNTGAYPCLPENEAVPPDRTAAIALLKSLPFNHLLVRASELSDRLLRSEKDHAPTINHGDFHPGNLLFARDGIKALVDWDYACFGSHMYDLSYALFMFCLEPPQKGKLEDELFSCRKTDAFLDGYCRTGSSIRSARCLNLYTEFVHLIMLDWVCNELGKPHSVFVDNPGFLNLASALVCCCR